MCVSQGAKCDPAGAREGGAGSANSVLTAGLVERWACDPSCFCKTEAQGKGLQGKTPSPIPSQPETMLLEELPAGSHWGGRVNRRLLGHTG